MKLRQRIMLLLAVMSCGGSVFAADKTTSISQLMEQAVYAERMEGNREKAIELYEQITHRHKENAVSVSRARQQLMRLRANRKSNPDKTEQNIPLPLERTSKPRKQNNDHRVSIEDWERAIELVRKYKGGAAESISDTSIKEFIGSLDEYSGYIDPEKAKDLMVNISGELTGIGVALDLTEGVLTVNSILPDSPAASAGLNNKDRIVVVDGRAISDFPEDKRLLEAVRLLRGKQGEVVSLGVLSKGSTDVQTLKITRDKLQLRTVAGIEADSEYSQYQLPEHPEVGYLHVSNISKQTAGEVRKVLKELADLQIKAIIIDLRGCTGGLLDGAVAIADFFLADGLIVRTEGRESENTAHNADQQQLLSGIPMAVLVDNRTASAGEIVAGALKQNDRAVVVGERTFGKGSVQALFPLENGGMIRLTTAEFILAGQVRISKPSEPSETDRWGIEPNEGMSIELTAEQRKSNDQRLYPSKDLVLQKAGNVLRSRYVTSE